MAFFNMALFLAGWLVVVVGGILLLVAGFKQGIGWGLAMLFSPRSRR